MKEQPFHQSVRQAIRLALGRLLGLFVVVLFFTLAPHSAAQAPQDNRQLNREEAQQANRASERRIALVIGNGAYTSAPPLKNPPNDARDMAATLTALGFEVTNGINVNQRDMKRLIRGFGQSLKAGVDVNLVLGYMDDAQNGLNIVILDACRNNPFGRSFRSASSGLAKVDAPTGTLNSFRFRV